MLPPNGSAHISLYMVQMRAVASALAAAGMYLMISDRAPGLAEASEWARLAVISHMLDHLDFDPAPAHRACLKGIDPVLRLRPLPLLVLDTIRASIE